MPKYNWSTHVREASGDFADMGCVDTLVLSIYEENTPIPERQDIQNRGTVETRLSIREIKTVFTDEFHAEGIWNSREAHLDIPNGADFRRALNQQYLDNYRFLREERPF